MYGLDIDAHLVRTAQMNLVLHGDGSSNVFRADSAKSSGEWHDDARRAVPYGTADVVLTNPPFGGNAKIHDSHILEQYELRRWGARKPRLSLPAEELFVEGAMRFLKPGGHLAIVLPRGILNNPKKSRFIRDWLLSRSMIVASIDLPTTTFKASGGVPNPSLLIVRKFTNEEMRDAQRGMFSRSYRIFMAAPETSGINNRKKPIYLRASDGQFHTDDHGRKIRDDQISAVSRAFRQWLVG